MGVDLIWKIGIVLIILIYAIYKNPSSNKFVKQFMKNKKKKLNKDEAQIIYQLWVYIPICVIALMLGFYLINLSLPQVSSNFEGYQFDISASPTGSNLNLFLFYYDFYSYTGNISFMTHSDVNTSDIEIYLPKELIINKDKLSIRNASKEFKINEDFTLENTSNVRTYIKFLNENSGSLRVIINLEGFIEPNGLFRFDLVDNKISGYGLSEFVRFYCGYYDCNRDNFIDFNDKAKALVWGNILSVHLTDNSDTISPTIWFILNSDNKSKESDRVLYLGLGISIFIMCLTLMIESVKLFFQLFLLRKILNKKSSIEEKSRRKKSERNKYKR